MSRLVYLAFGTSACERHRAQLCDAVDVCSSIQKNHAWDQGKIILVPHEVWCVATVTGDEGVAGRHGPCEPKDRFQPLDAWHDGL